MPVGLMQRSPEQRRKEYIRLKQIFPWRLTYRRAKERCNYPKHKSYKYYGGKGIRLLMTPDDFKYLWFRDKAYSMNDPTIDRENSNKDYTVDNCRYVERIRNTLYSNIGRMKRVNQLTKDKIFIKSFPSLTRASNSIKNSLSPLQGIWYAIKNNTPAYGYRWEYVQ